VLFTGTNILKGFGKNGLEDIPKSSIKSKNIKNIRAKEKNENNTNNDCVLGYVSVVPNTYGTAREICYLG
jgi:NRPS condensation-like uncharacterized protein